MGSYRDLKVYEKSYEAAKGIYELTRVLPREEQYGLTDQMRRAATSIPLTIAEGYGKGESDKELLRFLRITRGSSCEVEVLLRFVKDFGYITEEAYREQIERYEEIGRMISGLINRLNQNRNN